MVAPLQVDRRTVGFVMVGNPLTDVGTFEDQDLPLLDALAGQLRVFLEFDRLGQAFDRLTNLQGELVHQANHDPLTSLANRVLFVERTEQALAAGRTVAVMFVDLDDFKGVNDGWGHHAGDDVLCEVARRLLTTVRASDTVARLGGDEFAIVLSGVEDESIVDAAAERVQRSFDEPFLIGGEPIGIGASVGRAVWPDDAAELEALMRHADAEMYRAKRAARVAS
jgi:diguanylate cyclase (GGDEF)-like protein